VPDDTPISHPPRLRSFEKTAGLQPAVIDGISPLRPPAPPVRITHMNDACGMLQARHENWGAFKTRSKRTFEGAVSRWPTASAPPITVTDAKGCRHLLRVCGEVLGDIRPERKRFPGRRRPSKPEIEGR